MWLQKCMCLWRRWFPGGIFTTITHWASEWRKYASAGTSISKLVPGFSKLVHLRFGQWLAAICISVCLLLIAPYGKGFSGILIKIRYFSPKKIYLKISSAECRPFCFSPNVSLYCWLYLVPVLFQPRVVWTSTYGTSCSARVTPPPAPPHDVRSAPHNPMAPRAQTLPPSPALHQVRRETSDVTYWEHGNDVMFQMFASVNWWQTPPLIYNLDIVWID